MLKKIITALTILVPAMLFGYFGKTTEMGLAIVAGSITAAFINIDKIQRFKGAGFEAEMRKAVEEAYATIDNLKEMSLPLIVSMLNTIIYSGRWGGLGIRQTHVLKDDIESLIQRFKINDKRVNEAVDDFYRQHTWDLFQYFTSEYLKGKNNVNEASRKLGELIQRDTNKYPTKEQILITLEISEGDLNTAEEDRLLDYLFYVQHHKLRRNFCEEE